MPQLAAHLSTLSGSRFYNLSLPGSPIEQYINFSLEIPTLTLHSPRILVWMLFAGNDLTEPITEPPMDLSVYKISGLESTLIQITNFQNQSRLRALLNNFYYSFVKPSSIELVFRKNVSGLEVLFFYPWQANSFLTEHEVVLHPNWPHVKHAISAVGTLAKAQQLKVLIAVAPTKEQIYLNSTRKEFGFGTAVCEVASKEAVDCVDLLPTFDQEAQRLLKQGQLLWWKDDTHWNERGTALAAKTIGEYLERGNPREFNENSP